jgi:LPS sulfotransferase NodH
MNGAFDTFVVLAEMRTGSNFLETNLNALNGVTCYGEAFNPHFIGYPNRTDILGITQTVRDKDPSLLVNTIKDETKGIGGFRFFHDHDARVLEPCLTNPRCAKIILTRNPAESYVSWKIAQETGQWKLTDVKRQRSAKVQFDADEFIDHLAALQSFQVDVLNTLQTTGQTAFYIAYEDLQSVEVLNGLAAYLGVEDRLEQLDQSLKKQNPAPLSDKVANFEDMEQAVARLDSFNLSRTPNFEPRRGPVVPSYVAAKTAPLMHLPIKAGPTDAVEAWLAALDGGDVDDLQRAFTQKTLRQWKRKHKDHRSFTVLRHPALRVHNAFCTYILGDGPDAYVAIRQTLIKRFALPLPDEMDGYDRIQHRAAFVAFLDFVKANLAGQTPIRIDPAWCTQSQIVQGFGTFALPDLILRETTMAEDLNGLAARVGLKNTPMPASQDDTPFTLADIYDDEIETMIAQIYQRDYMMFGFGPWSA